MKSFTVMPGKWDAWAAITLAAALPPDPDFTIDDLAYSVESGESSLFVVTSQQGVRVACSVLRKEGSEMVMVAVGGFLEGGSITMLFTPYLEMIAAENGCKTMRTHTRKKGVQKLAERAGWKKSEIILRKAVKYGR